MGSTKYSVGDEVWVPSQKLGGDQPFALQRRRVEGQEARSVRVDGPGGEAVRISSRLVHRATLKFLVLKVGDLTTETSLLDPLAKSILQYLRMLVPDEVIESLTVRTGEELAAYMNVHGPAISHVILVAHGTPDSLVTLPGTRLRADDFLTAMGTGDVDRCLISLACKTGRQAFAGVVSDADGWHEVVAPLAEVHGAAASLFVQLLLHTHLVHGREFKHSARIADAATEGIRFRHWRNGRMSTKTTLVARDHT